MCRVTIAGRPRRWSSFTRVVICEGEFKAAVLWQEIGLGAALNYDDTVAAVGVCALPGISFVKNLNYRAELDEWLCAVECRKVIVALTTRTGATSRCA